jgi:hypothetical protein
VVFLEHLVVVRGPDKVVVCQPVEPPAIQMRILISGSRFEPSIGLLQPASNLESETKILNQTHEHEHGIRWS